MQAATAVMLCAQPSKQISRISSGGRNVVACFGATKGQPCHVLLPSSHLHTMSCWQEGIQVKSAPSVQSAALILATYSCRLVTAAAGPPYTPWQLFCIHQVQARGGCQGLLWWRCWSSWLACRTPAQGTLQSFVPEGSVIVTWLLARRTPAQGSMPRRETAT